MTVWLNKAPAPNRRPRFPFAALPSFDYPLCALRASSAAVGEARRYRDMKLHSILLGWSNPDQALRVAAGILGKRASGGRWPSGHYCQGVRSLPDNVPNLGASIRGRTRIGGHGQNKLNARKHR